jgi:hypothetical protein
MSTKKLFDAANKTRNYLSDTTEKDGFKEVESAKNLNELKTKQDTFLPQIDYSDPQSFAKFGSAYLYYKSAVERVLDFYPYDGSDAELNKFYNKSLDIEKYIFNERYPRTNGYITFCSGTRGWGGVAENVLPEGSSYGMPSSVEHITFFGGPNIASSNKTLQQMMPNNNSSKFQNNNIYDTSIYGTEGLPSDYGSGTRESNLKSNFDTGVTVEFWLQTGSLGTTKTAKQVVLDVWNNEASSSSDYGRITIELTGASAGSPFLITAQSGAASASNAVFTSSIGQNLDRNTLNSWKHYALSLYNSGSDLVAKLYVDGRLNDKNVYSNKKLGELESKNMTGRLGALLTAPSGTATDGTLPSAFAAAGKLSGSLDEFRFWKVARDAGEIGKNWFDQVRGGVNTDISNTTLGMYYKFNEGITGYAATDSVVLDYGGRLCNGTWQGYSTTSRNTGSAILSASAAIKEYEDPIIHSNHSEVISLKDELLSLGRYHDGQNVGIFKNLLPAWVLEESDQSENTNLDKVFHIAGAYFDKLHLQISALPKFKHASYTSASVQPLPFAQHLPQSLGLYTPEIFVDSTVIEKFLDRTETELFDGKIHEMKNLIYSNLYNNISHIYKAKGTERAIRNVLRCFNLNDNLVTYNVYSNNQLFELKNNLKQTLKKKSLANFNTSYNNDAVIYQASSSAEPDSKNFISCSIGRGSISITGDDEYFEHRQGFTVEAGVNFPKFIRGLDSFDRDFLSSSLFGVYTATTSSAYVDDTSWVSGGSDWANFQVYAVRDEKYSKNVYFILTSSNSPHSFPTLTSSVFLDTYDNNNWNLSVGLRPTKYDTAGVITGSGDYTYEVVFSGENNFLGTVQDSFTVSSSISQVLGQKAARAAKRVYIGSHKTNITGALQQKSDVLFSSAKYWTKYLDTKSLSQHTIDKENYGISGSYQNVSPLDSATKNIDTFNFNNLALNWYFGNVTSSDSSGEFHVTDLSSGSALIRNNYGLVGRTTGYLHSGKGHGFSSDDTTIVKSNFVNEFKFIDPERAVGSDMIQILDQDDDLIEFVEQVPNYIYTIEKSMYAAISEEILDFFAGVIDFHHYIGQPVNRYRERYKSMEALRRIFFERFQSVTQVDKFVEYYKWFDDAISVVISQLVPASADFVSDTFNTVESHVLERPKYQSKYPTIEFKAPDPEGPIKGIIEKVTSWSEEVTNATQVTFGGGSSPAGSDQVASSPNSTGQPAYGGSANLPQQAGTQNKATKPPLPTENLPSDQNDPQKYSPAYWKQKSQPNSNKENTSGNEQVDNARQDFQKIIHRHPQGPNEEEKTFSKPDGTTYKRNFSIVNQTRGTYQYAASLRRVIHGGVNFEQSKKLNYAAAALYPAGPVNQASTGFGTVYVPRNTLLALTEDLVIGEASELYNNAATKLNRKIKKTIKVQSGRDWEGGVGYYNLKSNYVFPFNIMSSSVVSGYNHEVVTKVTASITITNLHNDVYGDDKERPMQGPWSEYAVGGHQSRHVPLNRSGSGKIPLYNGLDDYTSRPEAWKIVVGRRPGVTGALGMIGPDYPWPEANEVGEVPYPMTASQKAVYYRDFTAKTPYVFGKNIQLRTSSLGGTILGNYRRNYEIINGVGATSNPRQFVEAQPTLPSQLIQLNTTSATQVRTFLDIHRHDGWLDGTLPGNTANMYTGYSGSHFKFIDEYSVSYLTGTANKSIIKGKFSNPGGLEVSPPGYRNYRGDEYSVYNTPNYRNLTVIKPSQGPSGSHSEPTGAGGPGIRVSDIHTDPITKIGKDYGLRSHLSRHAGRFFRDSLFVTGTESTPNAPRDLLAPGASYEQWPSFHRVHRNGMDRNNICGNEIHGPFKLECSDGEGSTLGNTRAAYWTSDDNHSVLVNTSSGTKVLNSPGTSAQTFISGARSNNGLSFSAWMRFTPTTEATDDVHVWGAGRSKNSDGLFHMHKGKTAPAGASTCAGSGSGNYLGFKLSTRSTNAPTATGTRRTIQYRAYVSGTAPNDILNQPGWRHIVVSLTGANGSLSQTLSCSFYIDGIKQHTCRNDTNDIQNYYDQALEDWGNNGFMGYGASDVFDFSDTANYRGDEFLVIGGNSYTNGNQGNAFSGAMDQITFWTKGLSDSDVTALFNGGTPFDITCSNLYNDNSSYLHAWYPIGEGSNLLAASNASQIDRIPFAGATAFTSASNAIWDMSGKQNHMSALQKAGNYGNQIVLDTGSAYMPTSVLPGLDSALYYFTESYGYCRRAQYDNFYVQHQIPRMDRQYAWFTGAIENYTDLRYWGLMGTYGPNQGMYSSSVTQGWVSYFDFVTSSQFGSYIGSSGKRTWGCNPDAANCDTVLGQPFMNLNWNIYEPILTSSYVGPNTPIANPENYMGHPAGTALAIASPGVTTYLNRDLVPSSSVESGSGGDQLKSGEVFNSLMLKRNSLYGWSTYSRTRQSDHPVLRTERKANRISMLEEGGQILRSYALRPVSLKGRPVILNMDITNRQKIKSRIIEQEANVSLETTYNNEFIYFNYAQHDENLNVQRRIESETTAFEQLVIQNFNPNNALNWIDYKECVYPALRNEFWSGSSYRQGFNNEYWRDTFWGTNGKTNPGYGAPNDWATNGRFSIGRALSNSLGVEPSINAGGFPVGISQSCWPLDAPVNFLTRFSASHIAKIGLVIHYGSQYWRPNAAAGELQNGYSFTAFSASTVTTNATLAQTLGYLGRPPGALYARKHMLDNPRSMNSPNHPHMKYPTLAAGGLIKVQDRRTSVFDFEPSESPTLANNGMTTATTGAGEALWEANRTAGYLKRIQQEIVGENNTVKKEIVTTFVSAASNPWWDSYDDFKSELKLKARGYSTIPEFRISEHVEDYINYGVDKIDTFDTFEIPHTRYNSTQREFYRDFSNSDFMKHFLDVHQLSDLPPTELKITAKAAIRLNPYKGFYPAQRTLNLVSQFSRSYGSAIQVQIPDGQMTNFLAGRVAQAGATQPGARLIYQPLFAPGILYNSIKAGVACDYPIISDDAKVQRCLYTGSGGHTDGNCEMWAFYPTRYLTLANGRFENADPKIFNTGTLWDQRVPFEAIITPEEHLAGRTFMDMEPHPSAAFGFDLTASFAPQVTDTVYTLMASNFFAEVGDFFLKDRNYSTLRGRGVSSKTQRFSGNEVFGARLRMRTSYSGSRTYDFESGATGDNTWFGKFGARAYRADLFGGGKDGFATFRSNAPAGYGTDPGNTGEFEIPQDPKQNPFFKRDFVMYNRTTAFGPPFTNLYPFQIDKNGDFNSQHTLANLTTSGSNVLWRGPNIAANAPCDTYNTFMSASVSGTMDCHNGYNWGWTPPYYHGEAWCDFIFRPSAGTDYTLEMILAETKLKQWRADAGPRTGSEDTRQAKYDRTLWSDCPRTVQTGAWQYPIHNTSPYNSYNINDNAMQLSHSVNLFGIENIYKERIDKFGNKVFDENEIVGKRWVIQPKFETPMLNFADIGIHPITASGDTKTLPSNFGADTTPNGMWHQFGIMPDKPDKGIFLEIGDIPAQWLQYHYSPASESSVYNNFAAPAAPGSNDQISPLYTQMKSYSKLLGFDQQNSKTRLGELAPARVLREAIVVVPYVVDGVKANKDGEIEEGQPSNKILAQARKKFFNIPKKRYNAALKSSQASKSGDSLDAAGQSIRRLVQKMDKYVLPPQFDFVQNPHVRPIVMYMLEFEYELDKDDLSYIWQNTAPRGYKKMSFQKDCVSHELINTELMTGKNILGSPNLRWMVFKVKQKGQNLYTDKVIKQTEQTTQLIQSHQDKIAADQAAKEAEKQKALEKKDPTGKDKPQTYPVLFNWPYDYVSFVELAQVEAEILFKDEAPLKDILADKQAQAKKAKEAMDKKKTSRKGI